MVKPFNEQLRENPLRTKADCEQALIDILEPAMQIMDRCGRHGRFRMSDSGAVYSQERTSIEGFCRLLWGLGPLFSNAENIQRFPKWWYSATQGIVHGCTPDDPDYWGTLDDYDQLFVEMAAVTAFLSETKAVFWNHLPANEQNNILTWLDQINDHQIPHNNWLWFRQLVNSWFVLLGFDDHEARIEADYAISSSHYLGHGWSYDGYPNQIDNYIPFAYQFFTLVMVGLTERQATNLGSSGKPTVMLSDAAKQRNGQLKERATAFVQSYANWFTSEGACLPFGRSLDYRFAQSAFWAAASFAKVTPPEGWSVADSKHLLLNNLRWWFRQNIFQSDGLIPIGYAYPNMNMAEGYNGPASAYWALKTFIFLCIPDADPFWTTREAEDFKFVQLKKQPEPRMLVAHSTHGTEVQAFTAGQHSHEHAHADAKYEKYVYSTTFGFSVPKGTTLLKQMAPDSTLAVSESEFHWRTVYGYEDYAIHDDYVFSLWKPWSDVSIQNFIVPLMPWHARVHIIDSARALHLAEGGFSLPDATPENHGHTISCVSEQDSALPAEGTVCSAATNASVFYRTDTALTGMIAAQSFDLELSAPEPNTNILYAKTRIPLQTAVLQPGHHIIVSLVLGDREMESVNENGMVRTPVASLQGNILTVDYLGKHRSILLDEI